MWTVELFEDVCETGLVEVDVGCGGVLGLWREQRVSWDVGVMFDSRIPF